MSTARFVSPRRRADPPQKRDAKQVLTCLQKAARVAAAVMEPPVQAQLSAELLSVFVLFYDKGVETVSACVCEGQSQ
jgi:hypothetical protein